MKKDELLLENIQLSEEYIYKMVATDRKEYNTNILKDFINLVLIKFSKMEYVVFNLEDSAYIILYYSGKQYTNIDTINEKVESETDIFVNDNRNVYI